MIIVIWIIAIMRLALVIGEIKYRFEYRKGGSVNQNIFMRSWNYSIDRDIDALLNGTEGYSFYITDERG